ncbi:MAG: GNAT family N-acetyltransferase [Anaerolineae bacterium]|nr:GNAT family N-acetyltransferase [Anaerolineae bacterium]
MKDKTFNLMDVVIRRLERADAHQLAHFYNRLSQASKRTFRPIGPLAIPEKCSEIAELNCTTDSQCAMNYDLIAVYDQMVIGWSFLWELKPGPPTFGLAVADAYHRMGIGARLMDNVLTWAKHHGIPEIILTVVQDNDVAWQLYEKMGFAKTGTFTGEDSLPYFHMKAELYVP